MTANDEVPQDADARTAWVIAADTPEEIKRRYNLWAQHYEDDLVNNDGYLAPQQMAEFASDYLDKDATILDAACGTGLSGRAMFEHGYTALTGLDFAEDMLDLARKTPCYRDLLQADLGEILPFATGSFDAVIKVGGSPVPPMCFHEFARITRKHGHIFYCGSVKAYKERGFATIAEGYVERGIWRPCPESADFHPLPQSTPELVYRIIGFEVIS